MTSDFSIFEITSTQILIIQMTDFETILQSN